MTFGNEEEKSPLIILAYGGAIGLGLAGLGLLLMWVIPAIGAAIGIATAIIAGGLTGGVAVASWIVPAASIGIAVGGGAGGLVILVRVAKKAATQPYEWVLPALAILSAFITDLCKELYQGDEFVRISFGATTTAVFFVGGLLWGKKGFTRRFAGTILYLLPPALVLARFIQMQQKDIGTALSEVPANIWIAIVGFLTILIVVVALAYTLKEGDNSE